MSALAEKPLTETLKAEFEDEDYRYAYDEEFSNSRMATQIKVIREQRKLKQAELADLAEMKQSRISALEDINYNSWSISTLRRLARALGVRLSFGFESWGELLPEIEGFGRGSLEKPSFKEDPAFNDVPVEEKESLPDLAAVSAQLNTPSVTMDERSNDSVRSIQEHLLKTRRQTHHDDLNPTPQPSQEMTKGQRHGNSRG